MRVSNDLFHTVHIVCSLFFCVSFNCRVVSFGCWCFLSIHLSLSPPVFDFSCPRHHATSSALIFGICVPKNALISPVVITDFSLTWIQQSKSLLAPCWGSLTLSFLGFHHWFPAWRNAPKTTNSSKPDGSRTPKGKAVCLLPLVRPRDFIHVSSCFMNQGEGTPRIFFLIYVLPEMMDPLKASIFFHSLRGCWWNHGTRQTACSSSGEMIGALGTKKQELTTWVRTRMLSQNSEWHV